MKYKISEICEVNSNNLSKKDDFKYIDYLDTSNLTKGIIGELQTLNLSTDKIPSRAKRKIKDKDILISTVRPNQKHYGIIKKAKKNLIASTGFVVLSANESLVDSEYLYRFLTQDNMTEYFQAIGETSTTAYPSIKPSVISELEINLPPLEEQKAIAKILSNLDEKIEVNNKINKNLEEMAQAIFKQWFVDFEFPNEEGKPYKSSGGEMVESELGMIPKDFNVISIYDVANIIYGAPFKSKLFNEDKKGLPLIRIRDLKSGTPNFYTEEEHSKATIVKTGDILVGMDAEFTPTIWHGETGYLNQRVCMFKSKISYISDYFLYESIKPYMKFMESAKVGTTVIHLGKSDIDKLTIILPSIDIIKRFSEISNSILVKMINIYNENRNLNKLRDTLLPKLMSGEIRVPLENNEN
ncbi:restriction endonuclease subunit S [Clostridium perfringens]|uniref:restriction endonuclease subunit S n=1 Tax=Clostridium perfringens TaxID=1502 RepID=UPI0013E34B0F|nr:restriction endonuclease subunit S [Clostridium perfringens]MCX0385376.1 restriction endonuclease subunit S [Clostridium perfringens]MDT7930532.1 restriction endonuclease subunit S [Clostridium perfringens]MDT7954012.1 restriction endonuclease subunit S [Clostridium perfringens]NGT55750.1 restriction endonuclease subunit S [Clostridium perfringens]